MNPDQSPWPWCVVSSPNPFQISRLPLIAKLYKIGFHRYKKRWAKRLFKRPARSLFDFAYHVLKLGGTAILQFQQDDTTKNLQFDARKLHFASVYDQPKGLIFEPQVMGLLELLLREDEVFFDIGANWGMEALHAALLPDWQGTTHAFEPVPSTCADLQSLVKQAGLESRIKCHNLAVSDEPGTAQMILADGIQSGTATLASNPSGAKTIAVRKVKLDDLSEADPTFMKLDVEGHEAAVLRGAKALIGRAHPFIIFETWHTPNDFENSVQTFQVLEDYGYVFFRPAWGVKTPEGISVWPQTQPPIYAAERLLSLIPMDSRIRPFMSEHIDVFACHKSRLDDLRARLSRNPSA